MKIYEKSVRNPISTIMIFIGVVIIGLFSMTRLSIDLYPDIDVPYVVVITTYPGASAADVESNVTVPLENSLTTVQNLKTLSSTSNDNISMVMLQFEWGTNLDETVNEIRDKIGLAIRNLPDDAESPLILNIDPSMMPILMISVTANESFPALEKLLEDKIISPLNRVNGVGEINILGAVEREIQVNLDPVKMEAFNLTVEQIGQVIATQNVNIPAGSMNMGSGKFSLSTRGEFISSEQIANLAIRLPNGNIIRLSEIATVKDTVASERARNLKIDGNTGVMLTVQKQSGANTVAIAKAVLAELEILKKELPPDVKIDLMTDSSEFIKSSINNLARTVMFAFIFVTLVVLFFIGNWRTTFIIALTIPVSLLTGFIYLLITGGSLNIITLSALVIALTLVVDDAIVVIENITKHIEKGSSPREASIYGTNEVWLAVIATTLTLVAVFFPLTLIGGMAGILFKPFGWIVCIVTTVSTIAGITLTPMLASKMLKFEEKKKSYKGLAVIYKPIDKFLGKLDNGYAQILTWAVRHRTTVIVSCLAIFASSLLLLKWVPVEFMPKADDGQITINIELEQSRGLDYTERIATQVTKHVQANFPEVERISTNTSAAEISVTLRCVDATQRKRDIFTMADELRDWMHEIPSIVTSSVTAGGGGMGSRGGDIEVKVFGHNFDVSEAFARQLQKQIEQIEGTRDVKLSRREMQPELQVVFDQEKLALYGLNTATAGTFLRNRVNGMTASKFRQDGDEFDIKVRFDEPFRSSVEDIENILFLGTTGHRVRVKDIGVVEEFFSPPSIQRENRQRRVSITMSLHGVALGDVVPEVQKIVDEADIPQGVSVTIGGAAADQAESFGDIGMLLILVVLLVYIVMATQFESLRMPFIIMFTLPFAFTGVFVALFITGTPLSLIALIGSVMLVGIVVKNGIVLVDFTNLQRDRGLTVNQAVITAGKSRLRPVLITSLTTILGLMPLAIGLGEGSETWQPMGIAIIGGMTVSTALTLIVVPVLYSVFGGRMLVKKKRQRIIHADEE